MKHFNSYNDDSDNGNENGYSSNDDRFVRRNDEKLWRTIGI